MSPRWLRGSLAFTTELLAAIPSVIYGLWAIFILVPLLRTYVQPFLARYFGWTGLFEGPPYGIGMLAAGIILAIMVIPIVSSITREVMTAVPQQQREAVLALGATRWEMIRTGVLRNARAGIAGGVILGLGRALGETMAVTMVIGNRPEIAKSLFAPGYSMASAIAGSVYILLIASSFGVPLGIGAGIYLSEYGRGTRLGNLIRFTADVLNGVPSIIVGIVAYGLVVLSQGHFSALAGGVALAIMMIPTITRTTEEMLLLVPQAVREAAFGLGVSRWRTTLSITLRTATSGVITGIMLAFARVAGETAPLLFTAFGNQYWNWKMNQPTAALPLQIFTYAISPFDEWHRQAWAGALILIILIVVSVSAVRIAAGRGMLKGVS